MKDRQSENAGRIKLVKEGTSLQEYYYMEMADNPIEVGTPLNKANLLSDTADEVVFGSTNNNHTVSDAFYELGSSRVRPYNNKLYTLYPDINHPYIDVLTKRYGGISKSHIVVTKSYYVVQVNSDGQGKHEIKFYVYAKTSPGEKVREFAIQEIPATGDIESIYITKFVGDTLGNIIQIDWTNITESGGETYTHYYTEFINVDDPTLRYTDSIDAGTAGSMRLIWQNQYFFWIYQGDYVYSDVNKFTCHVIRINSSNMTSAGYAWYYIGGANADQYTDEHVVYDDSYIYIFTNTLLIYDESIGDNTFKVLRCPIRTTDGAPSFTEMTVYIRTRDGDIPWTGVAGDKDKEWLPYWVDNGTIYFRRRTKYDVYRLYKAIPDNTNNKIVFLEIANIDFPADADEYLGHIDSTHVLFVGYRSSPSGSAKFTVATIGNDSVSYSELKTLSNAPSPDTPLTSVKSRIKHTLPSMTNIPAGHGSAIKASGNDYVFAPIYKAQTEFGVWNPCSIYAIDHDINGTATVSLVVGAGSNGSILTTTAEKTDIRYLPGYFREGRTT